jgi:hypothetical protein
MSHFAKIENGVVVQVVVAEEDFIATGALGDPAIWKQTSYNTRGGIHYGQDGQPSGREPLHKNYAGVGYTFDGTGFAPPQPFPSWNMNQTTYLWEAPVVMPTDDKQYAWNEATLSWDVVERMTA